MSLPARPQGGLLSSLGGAHSPSPETPVLNRLVGGIPQRAKPEIQRRAGATTVKNEYGEETTPDGVVIPKLDETNLGLSNDAPTEEYFYRAMDDDSISEILINDENTMFVKRGKDRLRVPGFYHADIEEYHDMLTKRVLSLATQTPKPIGNDYLVECQIEYPSSTGDRPVVARFHAVEPPVTTGAAIVTVAKMPRNIITIKQLEQGGTLQPAMSDFLIDVIRYAGGNVIVAGNTGSGKEIPADTPILSCRDGVNAYRPIGSLVPGDLAYDMDGEKTTITDVIDNGMKRRYVLHLSNGKTLLAGAGHQWYVSENSTDFVTVSTLDLMENPRRYFIPPAKPVNFVGANTPKRLSPYLVGMWLSTRDPIMGNNLPEYREVNVVPQGMEFGTLETRQNLASGLELGNLAKGSLKRIKSTNGQTEWLQVVSVEETDEFDHMFCISVDSPTKTYLHTEDNIVTHNTTLLRALFDHIYEKSERVGVAEDVRELYIPRSDVIYLTSSPRRPGETEGAVDLSYILAQFMRMRIDSIIIGESRSAEAYTFVQAANSGARKSLLTLHATSAPDGLEKLATYSLSAPTSASELTIRRQIAKAVDLVVYLDKDVDGNRRVMNISEVGDIVGENGRFQTSSLFEFDEGMGKFVKRGALSPGLRRRLYRAGAEKSIQMWGLNERDAISR